MVRTVAERLAGRAAVVQVDIQANPNLAARFRVTGVPVILLLREGREQDRLPGARPADSVIAWFDRHR